MCYGIPRVPSNLFDEKGCKFGSEETRRSKNIDRLFEGWLGMAEREYYQLGNRRLRSVKME